MNANESIAIIGLSGRFPGAPSLAALWQNIRDGVDCITTFSDAEMEASGTDAPSRENPQWVKRGTVLENADWFDASFFGYSPREAQIMDPQQRVFLECAWEALEHAGYVQETDGRTIGVYAGTSMNTYLLTQILPDRRLATSVGGYQLMLGNDKDFLTTRASYKLDLHGPSMTVQTACSTSLVAVHAACRALQRGECDMALAGGVSISFPQRAGYQYQEGMILSPDGVCRPFDSKAQGTRPGAGAGIVVLKRLKDAIADRDSIHAVILGAAINNDGAGKAGYTAPSIDGQVEVIAMAQALGGVSADTVSYVETHGTGTPLGDPIEIAALTRVFRAATDAKAVCTIGSLKANLGHLDAAAGVAGLIKAVLALKHRELPPLAHFRSPNPQLNLDSGPFRVATEVEPWRATAPRRAGVSSFGIGGTNAHVVLEEAPTAAVSVSHREHHLLVLSARTPGALQQAASNLAEHLETHQDASLPDIAFTLQVGRRVFAHRRAFVVNDRADAITQLRNAAAGSGATAERESVNRSFAFLFSGQGSQHAGMGAALYRSEPTYRTAIDECAALLAPALGIDIRELLNAADDATVSETRYAQPLLFATEYAIAMVWNAWGVRPSAMLGHSIGEYVAAHLAGVMSLKDALHVVVERGRLMQAMPPGSMLSVQLSVEALVPMLPPGVEIAAENAPGMCTVSGPSAEVARLSELLERSDVDHRALHTSHAFHSAMMEPMLASFREIVAGVSLNAPRVRYVSNVTGTWIRESEAISPDYYVAQLRGTVQFARGVAAVSADSSLVLLETGPGTALASLARITLGAGGRDRVVASFPHPRERRSEVAAMLDACGQLWTRGASIDWMGMHRDETMRRVPLPTYPFERQRYWVEPVTEQTVVAPRAKETAAADNAGERAETVDDWFQLPTWLRADLPVSAQSALDGTWLVFGQDDALTRHTIAGLVRRGATPVLIERASEFVQRDANSFRVHPTEAADYERVLRAVLESQVALKGAIHLWNCAETSTRDDAIALSVHGLTALGRALLVKVPKSRMTIVVASSGAQSVLGEPVTHPFRAMIAGATLVLPLEHGGVRVRSVDLDSVAPEIDSGPAACLVDEAAATDRETTTAWRNGSRWARRLRMQPLEARSEETLLRKRGVYVVTGGLGGIGLAVAGWLVSKSSARVLLVGRSAVPPREDWAFLLANNEAGAQETVIRAILRMEESGGEVMTAQADVADAVAMGAAIDLATAGWGEVNGVVHAAGVPGVGLIALTTSDDEAAALRAKVDGLAVLRLLLGKTPLDFMVLCSSVNSVLGVPGSSAYTAANAYFDAFAQSSERPPLWHTVAISWSAWREIGIAASLVVPDAMRGVRRAFLDQAISTSDGVDTLNRVLTSRLSHCVVSPFDVDAMLTARRRSRGAENTQASTAGSATHGKDERHSADRASAVDAANSGMSDIERGIHEVWSELLGVRPASPSDNFFESGGHSLMATRLLSRIEATFGVRLPLRIIFEAPTVGALCAVVQNATEQNAAVIEMQTRVSAPVDDREEFEL